MNKRDLEYPFVLREHDKFNGSTTSRYWPGYKESLIERARQYEPWPIGDRDGFATEPRLNFEFLHTRNKDSESFLLLYRYLWEDWMFIRDGRLIFNIDNSENIELETTEQNTKVGISVAGHNKPLVCEIGFCQLSVENLKKLADAKTVDLRISGKNGVIEKILDSDSLSEKGKCMFWAARSLSDTKKDDSWGDLYKKNPLFGSVFIKNGMNPFIVAAQSMYYCCVEKESHADTMGPFANAIKLLHYQSHPEDNPDPNAPPPKPDTRGSGCASVIALSFLGAAIVAKVTEIFT